EVASHDLDDASRAIWEHTGVCAAWLVPVLDDQGLAGALVLESTASDQPWSEADATALQTIAHHLGTVLRQRRAAVLEQEQRELLQGVLDASVDSIAVLRAVRASDATVVDFECVFANPNAAALLGLPAAAGG